MRTCKGIYRKWNVAKTQMESISFEDGLFHQWGLFFEEFKSGSANFTTAVVELPNGSIITPMAADIIFTDIEKKDGEYYKEKLCLLLNEANANGAKVTVHMYPSNHLIGIYFEGAATNFPLRNLVMIDGTPVRPMGHIERN